MPLLQGGGIDYRAARELQLIPATTCRDHLPVWVRVPMMPSEAQSGIHRSASARQGVRWELGKLAAVVQTKSGLGEFLERLHSRLEEMGEERGRLNQTQDVEAHWDLLVEHVVGATGGCFAVGGGRRDPEEEEEE